jgi:hypothetical protein
MKKKKKKRRRKKTKNILSVLAKNILKIKKMEYCLLI